MEDTISFDEVLSSLNRNEMMVAKKDGVNSMAKTKSKNWFLLCDRKPISNN